MAKKKRDDKDSKKNTQQDNDSSTVKIQPEAISGIFKPKDDFFGSVTLRPEAISGILKPKDTFFGSLTLKPEAISSIFMPKESLFGYSSLRPETISLEQDVEDKINELRQDKRKLIQEVSDKREALERKEIEISELQETIEQLQSKEEEMLQQQRLQHLFYRVHPNAWGKLKEDEEFRNLFEQKTPCPAVIMAIDIRRSTELMLKAKDADNYQGFIISLCAQLKQIILDNYGVFDKFTGDGILAFFPEFYSGDDATYLAVKAADECHALFFKHYENNRSCFTTILKDVGLGIGIDYGDTRLVNIQDWLTVIGTPVVYACRLSGAQAGQTLLNQQAYDLISQKFGGYINCQDSELLIKNEGNILAYKATLAKKTREINLPSWLKPPTSPKS